MEPTPRRVVLVDVAGGDEGHAVRLGQGSEAGQAAVVVAAVVMGGGQVEWGGEVVAVPCEVGGKIGAVRLGRDGDEDVAVLGGRRGDIFP